GRARPRPCPVPPADHAPPALRVAGRGRRRPASTQRRAPVAFDVLTRQPSKSCIKQGFGGDLAGRLRYREVERSRVRGDWGLEAEGPVPWPSSCPTGAVSPTRSSTP